MMSTPLIQRIRWWCLLLAFAGSTLATTAHAQRVGTFKMVEGLVWIERQGSYVHPKNGDGWLPGDRLFTGTNGSAVLNLRDGTLLTLAHGVQLEFDRLELNEGVQREGFVLRLLQGTMRMVSGVLTNQPPVVSTGDAQRGHGCSRHRLHHPHRTRLVAMAEHARDIAAGRPARTQRGARASRR
jgi:hypothetical protein